MRRLSNAELLERQCATESNARTYPRKLPLAIAKASGTRVIDVDGREYLDCLAGAGTLVLGHNHPVVLDAMRAHLADGAPLLTLDLTTPAKDAFVEALRATLPGDLATYSRLQFCGPSGSDAIEAAIKLAKTATGRRTILGFSGGYHGHTHGSLALMGNLGPKRAIAGTMADVHFLPFPHPTRCPMGCEQCDGTHLADYVEWLLDDPESGIAAPAAVLLEVVQGEGGSIPAPDAWLRRVREITSARDIPLIIDEVQTGWGRTGTLYACERAGVTPDILVLSKAIGGGLPLAVVAYHERLDVWQPGAHAGTFRGNQLAMVAGLATLEVIQSARLPGRAARQGARLTAQLEDVAASTPCIGAVRGRGLMIGVEIVNPDRVD
jgi:diaminobutyrate-2-oxoglutarate transaminase